MRSAPSGAALLHVAWPVRSATCPSRRSHAPAGAGRRLLTSLHFEVGLFVSVFAGQLEKDAKLSLRCRFPTTSWTLLGCCPSFVSLPVIICTGSSHNVFVGKFKPAASACIRPPVILREFNRRICSAVSAGPPNVVFSSQSMRLVTHCHRIC